jgi:antitoxin component YwqK of YwqJK toxin-antitoxin module
MSNLIRFETPEQQGWKDADGNLHGEYRRFFEDGTLQMVAHYDHGRREGVSEEYDELGTLTESYLWRDHRIDMVLHDMALRDANELIGQEYLYSGR